MRRAMTLAAGVVLLMWSATVAPAAAVADVAGVWKMSYTTQDGVKMASTLTLKVEGTTVSGTISSPRGMVALADGGTIKGDAIAFSVVRVGFGDKISIDYTGTVKGDTMALKMKVGARAPIDVAVKR